MSLDKLKLNDVSNKDSLLSNCKYSVTRSTGDVTSVSGHAMQKALARTLGMFLLTAFNRCEEVAEIGLQYAMSLLGRDDSIKILREAGYNVKCVDTQLKDFTIKLQGKDYKIQVLDIVGIDAANLADLEIQARGVVAKELKTGAGLPDNHRHDAPDCGVIVLCVAALVVSKLAARDRGGLDAVERRALNVLKAEKARYPNLEVKQIAESFYDLFERKPYYIDVFITFGLAQSSVKGGSKVEGLFSGLFMNAYGAGQVMLRWGLLAKSVKNIMLGHASVQAEMEQVVEVYEYAQKQGGEAGFYHIRNNPKASLLSLTNCPNFTSVVLGNAAGLGIIGSYKGAPRNRELFDAAKDYAERLKDNNVINYSALNLTTEERELISQQLNIVDDTPDDDI
nr:nucleoprotein [Canine pneumovirus]